MDVVLCVVRCSHVLVLVLFVRRLKSERGQACIG